MRSIRQLLFIRQNFQFRSQLCFKCLPEIVDFTYPPSTRILLKRKLAQGREETCTRSESSVVTKPGLELRLAESSTVPFPLPQLRMIVTGCETAALLSRAPGSEALWNHTLMGQEYEFLLVLLNMLGAQGRAWFHSWIRSLSWFL